MTASYNASEVQEREGFIASRELRYSDIEGLSARAVVARVNQILEELQAELLGSIDNSTEYRISIETQNCPARHCYLFVCHGIHNKFYQDK